MRGGSESLNYYMVKKLSKNFKKGFLVRIQHLDYKIIKKFKHLKFFRSFLHILLNQSQG